MIQLIYFFTFLFFGFSIFGNSNLIFVPYGGSENFSRTFPLVALKTKDKIDPPYIDNLNIESKGYTNGGIIAYFTDNFSFTFYNLNSYHRPTGYDSQFPVDIYPPANGNMAQFFYQTSILGDFTQLTKSTAASYYIKFGNTKGNINLYNYKTSPMQLNRDFFDFEKKKDKQDLYFPHYRIKYNIQDTDPKIGFRFQFEKAKVGIFLGSSSSTRKAVLIGNAFAVDRDKKPDFSLDDLVSYLEYNYSYNDEDYEYIQNIPLSNTQKETKTEGLLTFSLSLLKLMSFNSPIFETSVIELYYSPNDFTYSQRTNLLFHPNIGVSIGLIYLQTGKKDTNNDLSIQRNYEIGPLFRYGF